MEPSAKPAELFINGASGGIGLSLAALFTDNGVVIELLCRFGVPVGFTEVELGLWLGE